MSVRRLYLWFALLLLMSRNVSARPVVRNIRSAHEFDRLLQKHSTETGLPVIVDFYSDSCGPCRMMAPIFKKVASQFTNRAVFVKVDTNALYDLSSKYQIRSLPTFMYFLHGKKQNQAVGGIGEDGLRQQTQSIVRQAEAQNVKLTLDALQSYYQTVDASKPNDDIQTIYQKCADMTKSANGECVGAAANQLKRRLTKKYQSAPELVPRFTEEDRQAKNTASNKDKDKKEQSSSSGSSKQPNLHLASIQQLQDELERRLDEARDNEVEQEDESEDEADPLYKSYQKSSFPERMIVIGGGPAGMAAAIYGARAGLTPLVIAPSMGGQLQGKGVEVENYPGVHNSTGPAVIASMRHQAAIFGAVFEDDTVVAVDASSRPLKVHTNATGVIDTHTIVVATGAEANWLQVPGEWELRGGGVSSCATCDGFLFCNQHVLVVGGGDAAMEDALVLARTSKSVTVVHRRDEFRASKVLADRVLQHPLINVRWNQVVKEIVGKEVEASDEEEDAEQDLDNQPMVVTAVILEDVKSGETTRFDCDAVFVAIGHTPSTSFLEGVVQFDPHQPGYLSTNASSHSATQTSVPGIFAAGDVADSVYRQAITSAGSGAAAALDAERYLSEHGLGNEAAELEAELLAELQQDKSPRGAYNAYEDAGGRMEGMKESVASEL